MSMFGITTSQKVEATSDQMGGFKVWDTDVYDATIKVLYAGQSKGGAKFFGLHLTIDGKEYREQIYFTNKEGKNFYTKSGKDFVMPGFQNVDELMLLLLEKDMAALQPDDFEEKIIKLYDPDAKGETNQSAMVLTAALGKPVKVAIQKAKVFKQAKNANGVYENTADTREENSITKFFHPETNGTVIEHTKNMKIGAFMEEWLAQNRGETYDRTKGAAPAAAEGAPGKPGQTDQAAGATKSLFNRS